MSNGRISRRKYHLVAALRMIGVLCFIAAIVQVRGSERAPVAKAVPLPVPVKNAFLRFTDRATLSFELPGTLAKLPVVEGDIVEANAVVAQLNDTVIRKTLAIAEALAASDVDVRAAQKSHEAALLEYRSVTEANRLAINTFPEAEVQRRKIEAESTELEIEQKSHQLAIAKLRRDETSATLDTYSLRAPFAGIVTNVFRHRGEAVQQRESVLELVDTHRMRVDGYVELKDAWTIQIGDTVEVRVDSAEADIPIEGRAFRGSLRFIDVSVQTVRRVVRVWAELENRDGQLRDGLSVDMTIFPGTALSRGSSHGQNLTKDKP